MKKSLILLGVLAFVAFFSNNSIIAQDTPSQVIDRVHNAHGGRWRGGINDWTCKGRITFFSVDGGQSTFSLILVRKGRLNVQRVIILPDGEIRQGSNEQGSWQSFAPRGKGGFAAQAVSRIANFIAAKTVRSPQILFNYLSGFTTS